MINFNLVELSDKKTIDIYFENNDIYRNCDFCFTNLFAWKCKFNTKFSIINHTLFIRYEPSPNIHAYMIPIGKMPLEKSLNLIIEDAKVRNTPFMIKGITNEMWKNIEELMPGLFKLEHDRDNDEYIYLTEKLLRLKGKKLQSKRNHINRFKSENPSWEYLRLTTKTELDECVEMLNEWENLNTEKAQESLRYDYLATREMLDNFHELNLSGGMIRVNGKIIAFTLGEQLTEDTFVVHVEKAFSDINGAYAIINQQYVEHEASGYLYINREEDMGFEYLRKAKMSYCPDLLLQENTVTFKN